MDRLGDRHVEKVDGSLGWSISLDGSKVGGGGRGWDVDVEWKCGGRG